MTRDEIEYMLTNSEETLDAEEIEMLQGIFSLDELMAREVMVPRTDAFMIDINDDTQENIQEILKRHFSRIPVYDDDKDKIIGVLHTKRLLAAGFSEGFDNIVLRKILQEPLFVPETIFVEDLLEEIVGEIDDETDKAEQCVREIGEDIYIVLGTMTLNDFNDYFDLDLDSDNVDTIAGFYLTGVGNIPSQNSRESFEVDSKEKHLVLTNDKVKDGRVTKLKVVISDIEQIPEED